MKAFWRWTFVGLAVFTLLVAIGLGLALFVGLPELASSIEIDGKRLDLVQMRADHWALMGLGVVVAAVVITTMVVLAVLIGLCTAVFGTLVGAASLALVLSPIALVVWWLWWKEPKDKPTMPAS
jgi:MFS family permease